MQKVNIVCVGKIKEGFYRDAVVEYAKRLSRFADFKVYEVAECKTLEEEGEAILKIAKGYKIALCIEGKKLSSEALAAHMKILTDVKVVIYDEVKKFYLRYSGKKCVTGYSFCGRGIFAMHMGSEYGRQFIAVYAVHGREWITARLALKHLKLGIKEGWGGWIIPLLNPDGAIISQKGYPLWKANSRGVDLNCNFDAEWGTGKLNTRKRGAENCIGDFPFSEAESKALRDFTLKIMPYVTFAFHTKGEEIYWQFCGKGDFKGAEILAGASGYNPKIIFGSAGGYKDWCIQKLGIPSYTIECGSDRLSHPIKNIKKLKNCYNLLKIFTEQYEK